MHQAKLCHDNHFPTFLTIVLIETSSLDIGMDRYFHCRPCETVNESKGLYRIHKSELLEKEKSSSCQVLRPFFDDWPRPVEESESLGASLSISVPGNPSSDVSLKLNTGGARGNPGPEGNVKKEQSQLQWGSSTSPWGTNQMGGPLAEALRSSSTTKSMLHQQHGA